MMENIQASNLHHIKFALSLVNICLEAGGPILSTMKPLVNILRGMYKTN